MSDWREDLLTAILDCGYGDLYLMDDCQYDIGEIVEDHSHYEYRKIHGEEQRVDQLGALVGAEERVLLERRIPVHATVDGLKGYKQERNRVTCYILR